MFLTRMQINPRRRESLKLLASPQAMHAAVLAGFPNDTVAEEGRVLWRIDQAGERYDLLVVSPSLPDFTHIVEQAGWPSIDVGWQTRNYRERLDSLAMGQVWGFRLRANPVASLAPELGHKRGKVIGIKSERRQLEWLADKAVKSGFSLLSQQTERVSVDSEQVILVDELATGVSKTQNIRFARGKNIVTLQQVTFDGLLEITNPAAFREALSLGLGRARGYGCGLLTIAPVR